MHDSNDCKMNNTQKMKRDEQKNHMMKLVDR